jgi:hypothetical protein
MLNETSIRRGKWNSGASERDQRGIGNVDRAKVKERMGK